MGTSTAALIRRGDALLFVRRPPGGDLGGCWELPGGKVDRGETGPQALRRELQEELGIDATVGDAVAETEFTHRGSRFRLTGYEVEADLSAIELREHESMGFFTPAQAIALDLAPSDASLLRLLDGQPI
jgi:mutator protein MutT